MGFLATLIAGPALGVVGSFISSILGMIEKKQELKHEEIRQQRRDEQEIRLQEMNLQARGEEREHEGYINYTNAVTDQLQASYAHDASYGSVYKWAATLLRFVRPGLTVLLLWLVYYFWGTVPNDMVHLDLGLPMKEAIISKTLIMAEMAVTWWFLDRRKQNTK